MSTRAPGHPLSARERFTLFVHRQLDRRLSPLGVLMMRRTRGSLAARFDVKALLLTTVGRRTGRRRDVVLQYFPDGKTYIVAATNDGGASHPAWYRNLVASGTAEVEVDGRRIAVSATELSGEEAAWWWQQILNRAPTYERYARAAGRDFPILRLAPVEEPS